VDHIETVRATSWIHLLEELHKDSWDEKILRHRSPYVFRGCTDAAADLSTSLQRLGTGHKDLRKLERNLLRNFRKYAHAQPTIGPSLWNWLALAQHHGLPTRLLDWSYSPLVSLHFATEDMSKEAIDGVVWCLNHGETLKYLPKELRRIPNDANAAAFTAGMLDEQTPTLEDLERPKSKDFVLFLEPPSLHPRIENQFALFSLMSDPTRNLHEWLAAKPDLARRVIIPAELKWEVRDKLDQSGINERVLYPGLDGLAKWMSRYYRARPKPARTDAPLRTDV
jgi:hypothetical protein